MRESPRNLESKTTLSLLKWICRVAVKVFTTMKLVMVPPRQISAVVVAVKRQRAHLSLHRRAPHLRNVVAFCVAEMFAQGEGTNTWIVFITFSLTNVLAIVRNAATSTLAMVSDNKDKGRTTFVLSSENSCEEKNQKMDAFHNTRKALGHHQMMDLRESVFFSQRLMLKPKHKVMCQIYRSF